MRLRLSPMMLILASLVITANAPAQDDDGAADVQQPFAEDRRAMRERFQNLSEEERQVLRERHRNMTDEERQAMRERRGNMTEEERQAMRERYKNMTDEERQAMREEMRKRRDGRRRHRAPGPNGTGNQGV